MNGMRIREATAQDDESVREVCRRSFDAEERELVSELAGRLLREESDPATIPLVAESGGKVVGYVAFSPVTFAGSERMRGYILAPLAVIPDHQGRGVGTQLVEYGMARLRRDGVNVLLVYGDPSYYGRFGFRAEAAVHYVPPYALRYPHGWQACLLVAADLPEITAQDHLC